MMNNLGLGFVFTVRDLATSRIQRLERTFHTLDERVGLGAARLDRAFTRLGAGLAVFTAGAAAVGGALALANAAGQFETAIAQVALVSGASADELAQLRDAALEAGVATQFSPAEAAMGLRELTQVGFGARDSMSMLIPVLDLAAASMGKLTPQTAAGLAAQTIHAFGLEVQDTARTVDELVRAADLFALDTDELALGLGTASRGAQALHQSLAETLATMGLVKNVVPGIERASTAVAVSMERMVSPRTQRALAGVGVQVVDETGQFRSFLDIVQELGPALSDMSEGQRSAFLLETFGHHAMGGLQAVMTALAHGVQTQSGALVAGADAVAYLRDQFEHAGGAAERFRERMLATFEGQQRLLAGSLQTLAIVLGEPFAEVFRPMVGVVVDAVNGLIAVLRGIPAPVMRTLAGIVVAAGAFVALVGAVLASQAAMALFALAIEAAGVTLGSVAAVVLPAIAAAGALAFALVAVRTAFDRNVGGIAESAARMWRRVSLAFRALSQLFASGELSGEVRSELARAEHGGLRGFVIRLFMLGYRLQRVIDGVRDGFVAAIDAAKPVVLELQAAFESLSDEIAALWRAVSGDGSKLPSEEYRSFGAMVGQALGSVFRLLVRLVTWGARFSTGFVSGLREAGAVLTPIWTALATTFADLRRELGGASGEAEKATSSMDVLREMGAALGAAVTLSIAEVGRWLLVSAQGVLALVRAVSWARDQYERFTRTVLETRDSIVRWAAPAIAAVSAISTAVTTALRVAFDTAASYVRQVAAAISATLAQIEREIVGLLGFVPPELRPRLLAPLGVSSTAAKSEPRPGQPSRVRRLDPIVPGVMPAVAAARSRHDDAGAIAHVLRAAISEPRRDAARGGERATIVLQVDGETLARVTNDARDRAATRSFTPVPVLG